MNIMDMCRSKKKVQVKFLSTVFPSIKVSPFDVELNSASDRLILIDGNSV